jgi:hypothetical protein
VLAEIASAAFDRAAPFTARNFENEDQRNMIMSTILNAMTIDDDEILESLMKALGSIGKHSSKYLANFVHQLINMTATFISNPYKTRIAQLAIEFWTTVFETELKILTTDSS